MVTSSERLKNMGGRVTLPTFPDTHPLPAPSARGAGFRVVESTI